MQGSDVGRFLLHEYPVSQRRQTDQTGNDADAIIRLCLDLGVGWVLAIVEDGDFLSDLICGA